MEKIMKALRVGLMVGLVTLIASPVFARTISMKDGGTALWIFVIIGSIIVLLQLIPATILFFSFVGATAHRTTRKGRKVEDEAILPGAEPVL